MPAFTENVERWERSVQDEEDALEGLKLAEARYLKEIDEDKEKMEKFKQDKQAKKQAVDDMEEDISKARKDVANLAKEIHNVGSHLSAVESKIEAKKNERQNILLQAKVSWSNYFIIIIIIYYSLCRPIASWYHCCAARWTTQCDKAIRMSHPPLQRWKICKFI